LSLAGILVEGEKKGEKDTYGEKHPEQPIPWQPPFTGKPPEHHGNDVGKTERVGSSEQNLIYGAG